MLIHLEKLGKSFGEKIVLHDVTASVEREDRIGIVGQNGAGKTTLLKILTGEYQDYEGEFSVTHGVTLGYLEQNAKLDATLDLYGEMRSTFAPVLDAMAQMQVLERKMAAQPDDTELLARHDQLQNIVDAADGYNMDVNIKKVLSGMGFAQDTWEKNIAVLSGGELTRLRLAKLLLEKPDVLILDEPTNHLDFATMEWLENYLKGYSGAVLVVSHDRYFLDNVCTKIWEVSFQTMTTYKGNFSAYLPQKEAADALRQKQHDADVALAEKLQDYVDRNLVRASTTKMAQSRRRQLERNEDSGQGRSAREALACGRGGIVHPVRPARERGVAVAGHVHRIRIPAQQQALAVDQAGPLGDDGVAAMGTLAIATDEHRARMQIGRECLGIVVDHGLRKAGLALPDCAGIGGLAGRLRRRQRHQRCNNGENEQTAHGLVPGSKRDPASIRMQRHAMGQWSRRFVIIGGCPRTASSPSPACCSPSPVAPPDPIRPRRRPCCWCRWTDCVPPTSPRNECRP